MVPNEFSGNRKPLVTRGIWSSKSGNYVMASYALHVQLGPLVRSAFCP